MPGAPVAIITGAGSGIGRATALQLAALGHRLLLVGRRTGPLNETGRLLGSPENTAWLVHSCDVGDPARAREMISRAADHFGRLDALVNNAGMAFFEPIENHDDDQIARTFAVNTLGPIAAIAAALPHLAKTRGVIVNVSSMATQDPFPGLGVYAAAKAGIEAICKAVRNEAGDAGVRACAIAPGAVETPLLRSIVPVEQLPTENTLSPDAVAKEIVACVTGKTDIQPGETKYIPSPK